MNITIHRDGQNYGPYTLDNVRQLLASGGLNPTDLALIEGASEWTTLNLIPEITSNFPAPPLPAQLKSSSISAPATASSKVVTNKEGKKAPKSCFVWACIIVACTVGLSFAFIVIISVLIALGKGSNGSKAAGSPNESSPSASTTSSPSTDSNANPASQAISVAPKVGDTVKTSTLEITLSSVAVRDSVGDSFFQSKPSEGGTYVAVKWAYKNISKQPISSWSTPSIKLVDASGVEYSGDMGASSAFATELHLDAKILSDLNPGIKVNDADVFEISKESAAKSGWKVKISADSDISYEVDLTGK